MKMNSSFVACFFLFICTYSFADLVKNNSLGNGSSGGGAVVVCRDANNHIKTAELLDLYEAPILHSIYIKKSNEAYQTQITTALGQFKRNEYYKYLLTEIVEQVQSKFQFLPDGVSLNQPADIGENQPTVVPDGCRIEGLGFYQTDKLLVSKTTFNALPETDKAAFILHEAVYFIYREFHFWEVSKIDSVLSRQMTAYLFSNSFESEIERFFTKNIDWFDPAVERLVLEKNQYETFTISISPDDSNAHYNLYVTCSDYFLGNEIQKKELQDVWGKNFLEINQYCKSIEVRVTFHSNNSGTNTNLNAELLFNKKKIFSGINSFNVFEFKFARK